MWLKFHEVSLTYEKVMAKTVLKGLKASTSNFRAFRLSAKLSEGITMLVKVLRFLETKFGGLRVEKSSRNITYKFRGQSCQQLKLVLLNQGQATRLGKPKRAAWVAQRQNSQIWMVWVRFWVVNSSIAPPFAPITSLACLHPQYPRIYGHKSDHHLILDHLQL
ncbi:hypothetical protein HanIR_Chr08g0347351 [Helianthus annuus]|nr:hypothetical protein HanIR_Chr08g0347351 [Helianthus annuus]